jgi:hypothetical protein
MFLYTQGGHLNALDICLRVDNAYTPSLKILTRQGPLLFSHDAVAHTLSIETSSQSCKMSATVRTQPKFMSHLDTSHSRIFEPKFFLKDLKQ